MNLMTKIVFYDFFFRKTLTYVFNFLIVSLPENESSRANISEKNLLLSRKYA